MKKHLQHLKNEKGLTLVELLAVIVILAVVAVIGFVMIGKVIENSKKDAHISQAIQMIESAKLQKLTAPDDKLKFTFKELLDSDEAFRNAWTKEKFTDTQLTDAEVEIEAGIYKVNNFKAEAGSPTPTTKCEIDDKTEEALLKKDNRDDLCTP